MKEIGKATRLDCIPTKVWKSLRGIGGLVDQALQYDTKDKENAEIMEKRGCTAYDKVPKDLIWWILLSALRGYIDIVKVM